MIGGICEVCGRPFGYPRPRSGRRRKVCSVECAEERGRAYAIAWNAGHADELKAKAFAKREHAAGPLLPGIEEQKGHRL